MQVNYHGWFHTGIFPSVITQINNQSVGPDHNCLTMRVIQCVRSYDTWSLHNLYHDHTLAKTYGRRPQIIFNTISYTCSFWGSRKIQEYRRINRMLFSTDLTLVPLVKKYQDRLATQISQKNGIFEGRPTPIKPILKDFCAQNESFHSMVHITPYI